MKISIILHWGDRSPFDHPPPLLSPGTMSDPLVGGGGGQLVCAQLVCAQLVCAQLVCAQLVCAQLVCAQLVCAQLVCATSSAHD